MVDKELPVYAMTLIAMSFAVAWQLCYPSDGKHHMYSQLCIIVFLKGKFQLAVLWRVFSIRNDTSDFFSLPDGLDLFDGL